MRIVLAPDSFKGSLTAPEVCAALARGLARAIPDAVVVSRPMADGGEGTLDAVLAAVGEAGARLHARVQGASGERIDAAYGLVRDARGETAILECAQVVGITDEEAMRESVERRSTRGLGELMRKLLDDGVRRFAIGIGGSSTNDGGSGLLAALGVELRDAAGDLVAATPAGLASLAHADASRLDPRLAACEIAIMSDVNNPLTGALGATAIFGPQKGVQAGDVERIDRVIAHFASLVEPAFGRKAADRPGSGAAGGLGFALQLIGGSVRSGAEVVAERIGLDAALRDADWAITGEGRSDRQTLLNKAPFVVASHAKAHGVPVTLVSGAVDAAALASLEPHFAGCFALPDRPMTLSECIAQAARLLDGRAAELARLFLAGRGRRRRSVE
jgi:glycerate kinase